VSSVASSLVVSPPFVVRSAADQSAHWWPSHAADPRRTLPWACGSRLPNDAIAFVGTDDGPALWVRLVRSGQSPPRQDAVEVCSGAVAGIRYDTDLVAHARATFARQLVAGANGYVSPLVAGPEVGEPDVRCLIGAFVEAAEREQAVPAVLNFPPDDPLHGPLRSSGFAVGITDLYAAVDLPGHCFDDYLTGLPTHARGNVRRERRRLFPATATVHVGEQARARIDDAAALVVAAYQARGQQRNPADIRTSYRSLLGAFGDAFLLCVLDLDGAPVASTCLLVGETDLLAYSAGFAPAQRAVAGYFNTAYYLPIEWAYSRGLRRVLLGPASARAKTFRGATLTPMLSAVPRSCEPLVAALASTDAAMRAELDRLGSLAIRPGGAARRHT
jgi:hypothetical protein